MILGRGLHYPDDLSGPTIVLFWAARLRAAIDRMLL
jgi:hypothetical protein